jgi:hypothetical protein
MRIDTSFHYNIQDVVTDPQLIEWLKRDEGAGLENITEADLYVDFEDVKRLALDNADQLVESWFPDGERRGDEYVMLNPHRDDTRLGSFKVNLTTGEWADFALDDARGKNLLDLAVYRFDIKALPAASGIRHQLGLTNDASAAFPNVKPLGRASGKRKAKKATADDLGDRSNRS